MDKLIVIGLNKDKEKTSGTLTAKLFCDPTAPLPATAMAETIQQAAGDENADGDKGTTESEVVKKIFRVLSAHVIWGKGYPIDYSREGVVKKAVTLFKDKSIFKDHYTRVDNCIGKSGASRWNDSTPVPGVDVELCVDRELDPANARKVEKGYINRCSATVFCNWEQSHPNLKPWRFWELMGTQFEGQLVRIVITKIIEIYEISLVWYGADHSAKAVEQGINHDDEGADDAPLEINQDQNFNESMEVNMDPVFMALMGELLGKSITTQQQFEGGVGEVLQGLKTAREQVAALEQQVEQMRGLEALANDVTKKLKDDVLKLAKLSSGGTVDALQMEVVEQAGYTKLEELHASLKQKCDKNFPLVCQHCAKPTVERRNTIEVPLENTPNKKEKLTPLTCV